MAMKLKYAKLIFEKGQHFQFWKYGTMVKQIFPLNTKLRTNVAKKN